MANRDEVKGAEPKGPLLRVQEYLTAGIVYPGDFVKKEASGAVVVAAATDACVGVALSYAASGAKVLIADHPDQRFVIQSSSATEPAAQTAIGLNYNITVAAANTTYKRSGMQLDGATGATTATLPLRLVEIERTADNALGGKAKCIVYINNHQNGSSTGTAGV